LALYKRDGKNFLEKLNGIFAFALYDEENDAYLIGRDHMGIVPLYMGWDKSGSFYVASELKSLEGVCNKIEEFLPGHFLYSKDGQELQQWYKRDWEEFENVKDSATDISAIRKGLKRLSTDS
jgi:asparagine synthase (glutamine-hydrolysing)